MPSLIDKSGNLVYFGRLSWGNFFDWLITLCLSWIIVVAASALGGVRPEAHALLLPSFAVLLVLHGIWYAVEDEVPVRLNQAPLFFVPFLGLVGVSAIWLSPVGWRGMQSLVYLMEAFVFLWVLSSNVRTLAHLWVLLIASVVPLGMGVLIGFYQFFQSPDKIADGLTEYPVILSPEFLGQATGTFADPYSFVLFLLMFLPVFLFIGSVPRLPGIVRVMCHYVALMLLIGLVLTQVFWAYGLLALVLFMVPWFVFRPIGKRLFVGSLAALSVALVALAAFTLRPAIREVVLAAHDAESDGARLVLWPEAFEAGLQSVLLGHGAGSFGWMMEQSEVRAFARLPESPLNDGLLIFTEYGLLGLLLLGLPLIVILWNSYQRWKQEPFRVRLVLLKKHKLMPPQRFFLSIGLLGSVAFLLGGLLSGVLLVPGLLLCGVLFVGVLIKTSFTRKLSFPDRVWMRVVYLLVFVVAGASFLLLGGARLRAQAIELEARQAFDELIRMRVHISGNGALLDQVIERYQEGVVLDPTNADLWIGFSAAHTQLFFRNPSLAASIGAEALESAKKAVELSPEYWLGWSQVGIAHALMGENEAAEVAFLRGLELAPNASNAHFYWAVFASHFPDKLDVAKVSAERAIEINPDNEAARRLYQKLQIL